MSSLLVGLLLLAGGLSAQEAETPGRTDALEGEEEAYRIRPGDVLTVFVQNEEALGGDVSVRLDGMISVPLLGDVRAAGRSPAEVSEEMEERLERFVELPVVTVAVTDAAGSRVYVLGKVGRSGAFPLASPRMTILQALALAGGFQEFAQTDRILVVREGAASPIRVNYDRLEDGDTAQNVELRPGDTVIVP